MLTAELATQQKLAALEAASAATTEGLVIDRDYANKLVIVNIGGLTKFMPWVGNTPALNSRVRVVTAGGTTFCVAIGGSAFGTIAFVDGSYLSVAGDDGVTYRWPWIATTGWTPAGNDRVLLDHFHQVVLGELSQDPERPEVVEEPPPAPAPSVRKSAWFTPAWSGNWRFGSFAGSAAQISTSRTAAYGYGNQIANTIPDSASVKVAKLQLVQNWDQVPGTNSLLGLHTANGLPGSFTNASLSGGMSVPGGSRTIDLGAGIGDSFKTGATKGVGFFSGNNGYREYAAAPGSGRIYMEWET